MPAGGNRLAGPPIQAGIGRLDELAQGAAVGWEELVNMVAYAHRAMLWHHHAESTALFPPLRRAGRLRSIDVSLREVCNRQHRTLNQRFQRLREIAETLHLDALEAIVLASDLLARLSPPTDFPFLQRSLLN